MHRGTRIEIYLYKTFFFLGFLSFPDTNNRKHVDGKPKKKKNNVFQLNSSIINVILICSYIYIILKVDGFSKANIIFSS